MRSMLGASCLFLAALAPVPAWAQEPAGKMGQVAEKLDDPLVQFAVAGMLSAMTKAVLETRVEPVLKAARDLGGGASRLPTDATLADITGTDHAKVREEIVREVPRAMSAMGAMAGALDKMMPRLEKMAREGRQAAPLR